jgi:hypothetical protein
MNKYNLEIGFYWVRIDDKWTIIEVSEDGTYYTGDECSAEEAGYEFDELGPKIERNEQTLF